MANMRVPAATYRLQFNSEFGFDEARALIPYLDALGITDLYASPLLQAREGSEHGYDVIDPRRLDPDVGGRGGFAELSEALRGREMGLLLDIVPNHMAASPENPWWRDVLRWGPRSVHAAKFDINWEAGKKAGAPLGQLILPILDAPLAEVFSNKKLQLTLEADGFSLRYQDRHLPLCPDSYELVIKEYFQNGAKTPGQREATRLWAELMAPDKEKNTGAGAVGHPGKKFWQLYQENVRVRELINGILKFWNSAVEVSLLEQLLEQQHYRLVYWKETQRINYRRFFDINDLVSLRIEDKAVFLAVHGRVLELVREGAVTGLRIDHVDGLYDPEGYLVRLQEHLAVKEPANISSPAPHPAAGKKRDAMNFYVLVEKILGADERLPDTWPVAGTTGYDFLNVLNGLFINTQGLDVLDALYIEVSGFQTNFAALVKSQKERVMHELFAGEVSDLVEELMRLATQDPRAREIPKGDLKAALVDITAAFPVYRTYIRKFTVTPRDLGYIEEALAAVRPGNSLAEAYAFLRRILLLQLTDDLTDNTSRRWLNFVMRWQQFTGPIMAKGFEDTALYLFNRLLSLNEVGGNPAGRGISVLGFHKRMQYRRACSPFTMNATSTHDTKRSEDVRARINVLTEIPELWAERVRQWQEWNAPQKPLLGGQPVPANNFELLIYQTLLGAWPLQRAEEIDFLKRLQGYLVKAAREAKMSTSWLNPNEEYEQAICTFTTRILEEGEQNRFRQELLELIRPVAFYGALNSLAQLVLKTVCPGVPDFYMGTELWDFSLVDPDNRRPVDFERRQNLLSELRQRKAGPELAQELLASWEDSRLKLYVTWKALDLRRAQAGLFLCGAYVPLEAAGTGKEHLCALARCKGKDWVIAAVPRLTLRLTAGDRPRTLLPKTKLPQGESVWGDTVLNLPAGAPARWRNIFTEETVTALRAGSPESENYGRGTAGTQILRMARLLNAFPVALLTPEK